MMDPTRCQHFLNRVSINTAKLFAHKIVPSADGVVQVLVLPPSHGCINILYYGTEEVIQNHD